MSDLELINTDGLNRGAVLAALYNGAEVPLDIGPLEFRDGPFVMTEERGEAIMKKDEIFGPFFKGVKMPGGEKTYIESLYGRRLSVGLSNPNQFDPSGYDQSNGGTGAAKKVIDHLRETGEVYLQPNCSAASWLEQVTDAALKRYEKSDHTGTIVQFYTGTARHPDTAHISTWPFTFRVLENASKTKGVEGLREAMLGLINKCV